MKNSLISSFVVSFLRRQTKSRIDTVGVGTLKAIPSNLPETEGITFPIALAAPVKVGTMFKAAALALLKSLCVPSSKF